MTALAAFPTATHSRPSLGFKQFVALIAALMAVNALAIDTMLPALPAISAALGGAKGNQQQWIVTSYLLGFGVAQIFYGTLADRFGRRVVLLSGLSIYVASSIAATFATSFEMLIVMRIVQGIGSAATRVLAVSIVRDCYSGSQMARVMSLSFIVFLAVPIFAPSIGQIIMLFGPWRWIFGALAIFAGAVLVWVAVRLPETLRPEDRRRISLKSVLGAYRASLTNRVAVGYMLAFMLMLGSLFGFINSAQQIFGEVFGAGKLFTAVFAGVAFFMALSSFLNSRVVAGLGARRVSHMALLGFLGFSIVHVVVAMLGWETLWSFAAFQAAMMFCFGLCAPNFGALAMGPLGHVAGTSSSVQGFVTMVGGALVGFFIGQHFDGTTVPLTLGFAICSGIALVMILIAEKGRLFEAASGDIMREAVGAGH